MRTVIAGNKNIKDKNLVFKCIEKTARPITEVVSCGSMGVEKLGEEYAFANDLPVIPFWADWKYGDSASAIRNKEIAEYADFAIIIGDGKSVTERNLIENMRSAGKSFALWDATGHRRKYPY